MNMTVTVQNSIPTIAFFLHAYQPPLPIQTLPILKRIIDNCYTPMTQLLLENPDIRLTLNINASLTELLVEYEPKIIENLTLLAESKQIEFLESAAYHPLLPLIPEKYQKLQIQLNKEINQKHLGKNYKPVGFFPPELAIDHKLLHLFFELGFKYTLTPSTSFTALTNIGIPFLRFNNQKFYLLPRNRVLSNDLAFRRFQDNTDDFVKAVAHYSEGNEFASPIVGMDFETFGEHHANYYNFLFKAFSKLRVVQLQDLVQMHEFAETDYQIKEETVRASSWSTSDDEVRANNPFPLWNHPSNSLHQLTHILMEIVDEGFNLVEILSTNDLIPYLKSQQSCQLWWESDQRLGVDIVKRAINFQVASLEQLRNLSQTQNKERSLLIEELLKVAQRIVERINMIIEFRS